MRFGETKFVARSAATNLISQLMQCGWAVTESREWPTNKGWAISINLAYGRSDDEQALRVANVTIDFDDEGGAGTN